MHISIWQKRKRKLKNTSLLVFHITHCYLVQRYVLVSYIASLIIATVCEKNRLRASKLLSQYVKRMYVCYRYNYRVTMRHMYSTVNWKIFSN